MLAWMPQDFLADLAARYGLSADDRERLSALIPAPPMPSPGQTQFFTPAGVLENDAPLLQRPTINDPSGRYQAMAVLGRGGMGEVHRVWDRVLDRSVAMKVILPMRSGRSAAIARFEQEARLAAQLQHPGIVAIYDLGRLSDGRLYITMEEVRGEPLARVLQQRRSPQHRIRLLAGAAETVAYAHSHGVLHRDLKPSNIMVVGFDDIKIVDWGIAGRLPGHRRTAPPNARRPSVWDSSLSAHPGTPAYMAPELLSDGTPSEAADVYALGVILYRSLSDQLPFPAAGFSAHLERVRAGDTDPPSLPQTVPAPLAALCRNALSPRPVLRPTAAQLAAALKAYLNGEIQREAALALVAEAGEIREELEDLQLCADDLESEGSAELKDIPRWQDAAVKQSGWRSLDQARSTRE
ncbi:MAG: serine/threonine protein kinase, partial [Myxococcota bacterium]